MKTALEGIPEQKVTPPPGIISVTIDKSSGKLSGGGGGNRSVLHRRNSADGLPIARYRHHVDRSGR